MPDVPASESRELTERGPGASADTERSSDMCCSVLRVPHRVLEPIMQLQAVII